MPTVVLAAGGTGGHVYPALSVAAVLRARGYTVVFFGGDRMEATAVPEAGFELYRLPVRTIPASPGLAAARGAAAFAATLVKSRALLRRIRPVVFCGLGGYASLGPALAASSRRIPVVLHEQNAQLLASHRPVARLAFALAVSLPLEKPPDGVRVVHTGNPVRPQILSLLDAGTRERARAAGLERFGLDPGRPTVLAFGGSLGAGVLNESVPGAAPMWGRAQVLHICGRDHGAQTRARWSRTQAVRVAEYVEAMHEAYAVADVVVARGGATTAAELLTLGLPSVLVGPSAQARWAGAQRANVRALTAAGASLAVEEGPALSERLGAAVSGLLDDRGRRSQMAAAARAMAHPDAADRLAGLIEEAGLR